MMGSAALYEEFDRGLENRNDPIDIFCPKFVTFKIKDSILKIIEENDGPPPKKLLISDFLGEDYDLGKSRKFPAATGTPSYLSNGTVEEITNICRFALEVRNQGGFNQFAFTNAFCDEMKDVNIELLWMLDRRFNLIPMHLFFMKLEDYEFECYKRQFLTLIVNKPSKEMLFKHSAMLNDILETFINGVHSSNSGKNLNEATIKLKTMCSSVLDELATMLMENDDSSEFNFSSHEFALKIMKNVPLIDSIKIRYLSRQLVHILTYENNEKSRLNAMQTLAQHESIIKATSNIHLKSTTIDMLLKEPQTPQNVQQIIMDCLKNPQFHWVNLLTITVWKHTNEKIAIALAKDMIKDLMFSGLLNFCEEEVTVSFILARHFSIISSKIFPKYEKWYSHLFEDENYSPAKDNVTFTFLMQVLTKFIPFDPPQFLHAQISNRPFIPPGCRDLWTIYVSLGKERVLQYNDAAGSKGLSLVNDPINLEIENAVKYHEAHRTIPQSILTLRESNRTHYFDVFLPMLLKKPTGPAAKSSKQRAMFIENLNIEGYIPANLYHKYKSRISKNASANKTNNSSKNVTSIY